MLFTIGVSASFGSQYKVLGVIVGSYVILSNKSPVWDTVLKPILKSLLTSSLADAVNPTISLFLVHNWILAPSYQNVSTLEAAVSAFTILSFGFITFGIGYWKLVNKDLD